MFIVFGGSDTLFLRSNSSICDKIIKYTCPTHHNLYLGVKPYNFVANRTITT